MITTVDSVFPEQVDEILGPATAGIETKILVLSTIIV
jgi:hypothetical protein